MGICLRLRERDWGGGGMGWGEGWKVEGFCDFLFLGYPGFGWC